MYLLCICTVMPFCPDCTRSFPHLDTDSRRKCARLQECSPTERTQLMVHCPNFLFWLSFMTSCFQAQPQCKGCGVTSAFLVGLCGSCEEADKVAEINGAYILHYLSSTQRSCAHLIRHSHGSIAPWRACLGLWETSKSTPLKSTSSNPSGTFCNTKECQARCSAEAFNIPCNKYPNGMCPLYMAKQWWCSKKVHCNMITPFMVCSTDAYNFPVSADANTSAFQCGQRCWWGTHWDSWSHGSCIPFSSVSKAFCSPVIHEVSSSSTWMQLSWCADHMNG